MWKLLEHLTRCNDLAAGWIPKNLGSILAKRKRFFSFPKPRPALESSQPSIQWVLGAYWNTFRYDKEKWPTKAYWKKVRN